MESNLYLIGMMGSGKSVTGRELAAVSGRDFVDLDAVLEADAGKTISQIFAEEGEPAFRAMESRALEAMTRLSGQVIATGGGVILSDKNVALMKASGVVVYLQTSLEGLIQRLEEVTDRPLLDTPEWQARIKSILSERESRYKAAASLEVATDGKTAEEVAASIQNKLIKEEL